MCSPRAQLTFGCDNELGQMSHGSPGGEKSWPLRLLFQQLPAFVYGIGAVLFVL